MKTEMENNSKIKYIVYCTTNLINGKIYVGVHKTNPEIWDFYLGNGVYANNKATYERSQYAFQRAVKKYGPKNFKRSIIKEFPYTEQGEEEAFYLEADIVNEEFLKRPDVYNMALGGKIGRQVVQRIPCYQYDSDGNFIKEYKSYNDASKELNRNLRTIQRAIKDKIKCAGYYITNVKYNILDITKMHNYEGYNCIPVYQYSSSGQYDCCYDSINDASRVLGIHSANISRAIKLGTICNDKYFSDFFSPEYRQAKTIKITSSEIHQYGLDGKYIASYKNMQEAKNKLGIKSNIYNAIKLKQTCGGFQWSFEKLDNIAPIKPKSGRPRRIGKYDKNWNLIKEYKTLQECKNENGSGLIHVLQGRDEFAKGFRYKYLD